MDLISSLPNSLEWQFYKGQYGKLYRKYGEELARYKNFMATKMLIKEHNKRTDTTYKMNTNQMSDWTKDEFVRLSGEQDEDTSENSPEGQAFLQELLAASGPLPDELDWRQAADRVTPVKDQGRCGSCWAFATTGVLEGQQVARNYSKRLVPLSELQLIDCPFPSNFNRDGGLVSSALEYIGRHLEGLEATTSDPFDAEGGERRLDRSKMVRMPVMGAVEFSGEDNLKRVVARFGPVAANISVNDDLRHYGSGVFTAAASGTHDTRNHAVLVVGYGTDPAHGAYWLIKNSWSERWGERGYLKLKRGVNMCSIGDRLIIPTFSY